MNPLSPSLLILLALSCQLHSQSIHYSAAIDLNSVNNDIEAAPLVTDIANQGGVNNEFTINNLPAGLTPTFSISSDGSVATLQLGGVATNSLDSDDVQDLQFTFNDAAFTTLEAAGMSNGINASSGLGMDFLTASKRAGAVSFVVDGTAFVGLGENETGHLADFYRYETLNDTFFPVSPFPGVARSEAVAFVIGSIAYVGSGVDALGNELADFYAYNNENDTWTSITNLAGVARSSAVAFSTGGAGYVGTGFDGTKELDDFWRYDPVEDTWTSLLNFTGGARREAVAFTIHDKAYVATGVSFDGFTNQFSDVQEFDPVTQTWTERVFANIDLGFQGASVFTLFDQAYISYGNLGQITRYDPLTNEILDLGDVLNIDDGTIGDARADAIAFALQDVAYFGFGRSGFSSTTYFNDLITYTVPNEPPTSIRLSNSRVFENLPINSLIATITVNDPDIDNTHNFSLITGNGTNDRDNRQVSISDNSIISAVSFDFEIQSELLVYLRVTDNFGASLDTALHILITDLNEPPTSIRLSNSRVFENLPINSLIATITVNDPDIDNTHNFSLITGNGTNDRDNRQVSISDNSIISAVSFDFEIQSELLVYLRVTDNFGASLDTALHILITDLNEPPVFTSTASSITIPENTADQTVLVTFTAEDPEGDDITFRIQDGNIGPAFAIDEDSGVLSVRNSWQLDFEFRPKYNLVLEASDGFASSTTSYVVDLTNVNEAPRVVEQWLIIAENAAVGTVVGELTATDQEGDELTYTIKSGNDLGAFALDAITGVLTVANSLALDFETSPQFDLVVEASDGILVGEGLIRVLLGDREDPITSLEENILSDEVTVFPNPASTTLTILSDDNLLFDPKVSLIGMAGQRISLEENSVTTGTLELDVSALPAGMYFLTVVHESKIRTWKIQIGPRSR